MEKTPTPYTVPLRILQYVPSCCAHIGMDLVPQNWYHHLDKNKIVFDFAVLSDQHLNLPFKNLVLHDGNRFLAGTGRSNGIRGRFSFYRQLFIMMRKNHYDAFFVHESTPLLLIPCWLAKLAGIRKIFLLSHNAIASQQSFFVKKFLALSLRLTAPQYLAVSEQSGKGFYGNRPFAVFHVGIETKKFNYSPTVGQKLRAELSMENNWVMGFVGRLAPEKNVLFLLKVFQQILHKKAEARLVLVGSGPQEQMLRQEVRNLGIAHAVLFLGKRPDSAALYQAFDTFVLPSLFEGLPLVHLEAQSCGLPCFLSDSITQESNICNTFYLPLEKGPAYWANVILEKTKNFQRKDGSSLVKQAGFDIADSTHRLEELLKNA